MGKGYYFSDLVKGMYVSSVALPLRPISESFDMLQEQQLGYSPQACPTTLCDSGQV